jgi:hypothetical protein
MTEKPGDQTNFCSMPRQVGAVGRVYDSDANRKPLFECASNRRVELRRGRGADQ